MIMSRELHSSAVAANDEFYQIVSLQQLNEISLEQLEIATQTPEQRRARTGLLITSYLHQVEPCLDSLKQELKEIQQLATRLSEFEEVRNG